MKHLFIFLLLVTWSSHAQIPNPFHKNVEGLAKKFKNKYPDDSMRVVAIYDWINSYMRYDLKAYKRYNFKVNSYSLSRTLYRRKTMAYGFSKLFQDICLRSGVKCAVLEGYAFENPDDAYIHYYYEDHAWNAAAVNGHWYLFDVTHDNGFVKKKKRKIRKFLNRTVAIPLLYDKIKFVHKQKNKFSFQSGSNFSNTHYPILINGLLIDETLSIESFASGFIYGEKGYNPSFYPGLAQLADYAGTNTAIQLKIAADQSQRFNPKNNFVKAVNYYNSMRTKKGIRSDFNKSDVDTVVKYAALFKKDNSVLHARNIKRVTDEHKNLSATLEKVFTHNNRMAIQYNKKAIKAIDKLTKTTATNAVNSNKIEERQLKLEEQQAGSKKKFDTIPFRMHLEEYQKTLSSGDSLMVLLNKNKPLLDSLNARPEELFHTLYNALKEREILLNKHRVADMKLMSYPQLRTIADGIDSMTRLVDYCINRIDKTEKEYNKLKQQTIRCANIGFTLTSKEYIKMQTGITVPQPYSKDTMTAELQKRTALFKESLVDLYHHDEAALSNQRPQFRAVARFLKEERITMRRTAKVRAMAYDFRLKLENRRYKAYDHLITTIANNMHTLKMTYKKKVVVKGKK